MVKIILLIISTLIGSRVGTSKIRRQVEYLMTVPTGDICFHKVPTRLEYGRSAIRGGLVGFVVGLLLSLL